MKKNIAALFIFLSLFACSSEQSELEKTRAELRKTRAELEKINDRATADQERWKKAFGGDAIERQLKSTSKPTSNNF